MLEEMIYYTIPILVIGIHVVLALVYLRYSNECALALIENYSDERVDYPSLLITYVLFYATIAVEVLVNSKLLEYYGQSKIYLVIVVGFYLVLMRYSIQSGIWIHDFRRTVEMAHDDSIPLVWPIPDFIVISTLFCNGQLLKMEVSDDNIYSKKAIVPDFFYKTMEYYMNIAYAIAIIHTIGFLVLLGRILYTHFLG